MSLPQYISDLPDTDEVRTAYERGVQQAIDWILDAATAEDCWYLHEPDLGEAVRMVRKRVEEGKRVK